jgi:hypothetical protein
MLEIAQPSCSSHVTQAYPDRDSQSIPLASKLIRKSMFLILSWLNIIGRASFADNRLYFTSTCGAESEAYARYWKHTKRKSLYPAPYFVNEEMQYVVKEIIMNITVNYNECEYNFTLMQHS